jgi:hypothetical protein
MAIDYSQLAIPKGTPSVLTKGWKKRDNLSRMQTAFDAVDARDGLVSRISGKPLLKESPDQKLQRDHCHMRGRNVDPVEKYNPKRIFNASRYEHKLFDAHAIEVEGTDADQRLIFRWNRNVVPVGQEPFKLLSKRRSQNL